MKASDGATITIRLKQPITEPLTGLVEVYGTGQGKNLVVADSFTLFPEQVSDNFRKKEIFLLIKTKPDEVRVEKKEYPLIISYLM